MIIEKPVAGGVPVARLCAKDVPGSEILLHAMPAYVTFVEVTPELASDTASLREALDYERRSPTAPPVVRQEIAEAVQSAAATIRRLAWIPVALTLVTNALNVHIAQARRAVDLSRLRGGPAPPTTPEAIYEALISECVREVGFAPPAYVDVGKIQWMLSHLAIGATRGGGQTAKISAAKMRTTLADEKKLARLVPPKPPRRSDAKAL